MPLCATVDEVKELPLPDHWMRKWFIAALQLELQENRKGLQSYANLVKEIPASAIGVVQMAVGHYNMREFDRAQNIFEDVYSADPYRLEGMDIYSNILYVKERERKAELSRAQRGAHRTSIARRRAASWATTTPSRRNMRKRWFISRARCGSTGGISARGR